MYKQILMDRYVLIQEEPRGASQLVEIMINSNGLGRVKIDDQPQLRSQDGVTIIHKALRLITPKILTDAPTAGAPNAPIAELQKISLVLYSEGWEKGQYIPLLTLNDMVDADSTAATTIPYRNKTTRLDNWKNVDWNKSYLQLSNGTATANSPYCVLIEVEYVRLDAGKKEIVGPA